MTERMRKMKYKEQKELVDGLRAAADFFEQHIEVPVPSVYISDWIYDDTKWDKEERKNVVVKSAKDRAVEIARALKPVEKKYDSSIFELVKKFSESVRLSYKVSRDEVCRKVVVGTKEV